MLGKLYRIEVFLFFLSVSLIFLLCPSPGYKWSFVVETKSKNYGEIHLDHKFRTFFNIIVGGKTSFLDGNLVDLMITRNFGLFSEPRTAIKS